MEANLKAKLATLVKLARTNPEAAIGALKSRLGRAEDWRERQQIELALRHAERAGG